jgi:signal transduction histidine kinase
VGKSLDRVFRLAAKYYAASLTVWLVSAPLMIIGLLFTEATHFWQVDKMLGIIVAGTVSHLALGVVLWVARRTILAPRRTRSAGGREVLFTYVVGGLVRALAIGFMLDLLGISSTNFVVRIPTSIALVTFSFTLFAYSAQLWWEYRSQRKNLLMSIAVGESSSGRHDVAARELHPVVPTGILQDVDQIRSQTAEALQTIRASVRSGDMDSESVDQLLLGSDRGWREVSHKAWTLGTPKLPAIGPIELARTMASSRPFSLIAVASGPVYGFFRVFDALPISVAITAAAIWWLLATAIAITTNLVARAAGEWGVLVLIFGYLLSLGLAVLLAALLFDDLNTQSQLVFVALVSTSASLALGFPPALERSGEQVLEQLEKRLDAAAVTNLRSQGDMFVLAQRIAGYLHSEVRGDFLRHSLALREALERGNPEDIETVLDRLDRLLSSISLDSAEYSGVDRLIQFLDNWATLIDLTHNVNDLPEDTRLDPGLESIVMEAVNDAVRHGDATAVAVNLQVTDHQTRLDVVSNGSEPEPSDSVGLGTQTLDRLAPGAWSRRVQPDGNLHLEVVVESLERH